MVTILIENKLKEYQNKVAQLLGEYIKEAHEYRKNGWGKTVYKFKSIETLVYLARKEIYPYIVNTQEKLNEEFFKRTNYYSYLSNDDVFKELQNQLHADINKLYSFVNIDEALFIEEMNKPYIESYCIAAIESLNVNDLSIDDTRYYEQIIELIKEKSNFYTLNFDKTCDEIYEESMVFQSNSMLDIQKILAQYENIEQPVKIDLINKFPELIEDIDIYQEIYATYKINKNKLAELLMKDFESKGLHFFHLFNNFVNCDDNCKFIISEQDKPFKCINCFTSVLLILIHLTKHIEELNGDDTSTSDDKLKQIDYMLEPLWKGEPQNKVPLSSSKTVKFDDLEWEIVGLVAKGLTNPQIAERMYKDASKDQQVKNRLTTIYEKLSIENEDFTGTKKNKKAKLAEFYKNNIEKDLS